MSTPLITEQSVHAAADELKAENKTVSYRAVAKRIGGGSHRDIQTHLATWWAKQGKTLSSAASAATMAAEVEKLLREATTKIETAFQRRLSGDVTRIREESENNSRVATARLEAAAEDISTFQDEVDGLRTQLTEVQAKLDSERQQVKSLTTALNEERAQRSILTAVESSTQQRLNDLKTAQSALMSEIAAEREATASSREHERHLRDQLEQARSAAISSQQQLAHALAEGQATRRRLHDIESEFKAELDASARNLQQAQLDLAQAREHAARIQGELDGVRGRRKEGRATARPVPTSAAKGKAVALVKATTP